MQRVIPPHVQAAVFSGNEGLLSHLGKIGGKKAKKKKEEPVVQKAARPEQLELVNVSTYPD